MILNFGVGPVHQCQYVRGYGTWLEDVLLRPVFAEARIDRVADLFMPLSET